MRKTITVTIHSSELDAMEDVILTDYQAMRDLRGKPDDDRLEVRDRKKALKLWQKLVNIFDEVE